MSKYYGLAFSPSNPSAYPSLAPTFITFRNALTGQTLAPPTLAQIDVTGIYGFTFSATFPVYFLADGITTATPTERYVYGVLDPAFDIDSQVRELGSTLVALGNSSVALGSTSIALGTTNVALNTSILAVGTSTYAIGGSILAVGNSNLALGNSILAVGTSGLAVGNSILAIGTSTYAELLGQAGSAATLTALIGNTSSTFGTNVADPTTLFGYMKRMQEFNEGAQTFSKLTGTWTINSRGGSLIATKTLNNSSSEVSRN